MVGASKKVNYYRLALRSGRKHRMILSGDDRLKGYGGGYFSYLAAVFDSGDENGTWHRLRLEGDFYECKYEIMAAASNEDLRYVLEDESVAPMEQLKILKKQSWTRKVNTGDMLLHGIEGRFLWVFIGVTGASLDSQFQIEGFQVEFPQKSFVEYLPEIYQNSGRNSFFERYMAVFQSLYEDLEKEIDRLPEYLDYETAPDEYLPLFAEWTGNWASGRGFSAKQMRYLFRHLQRLQSGRGTRRTMRDMICMFTGKDAVIVEYFKWHDWMERDSSLAGNYEQLFGKSKDTFSVIIDASDSETGSTVSREKLMRLLEDYIPFGMHCNIVLLEKNSHMDSHCYLDKNSCLATPVTADTCGFGLDGNFILS